MILMTFYLLGISFLLLALNLTAALAPQRVNVLSKQTTWNFELGTLNLS